MSLTTVTGSTFARVCWGGTPQYGFGSVCFAREKVLLRPRRIAERTVGIEVHDLTGNAPRRALERAGAATGRLSGGCH
jgi:hypothetical protein